MKKVSKIAYCGFDFFAGCLEALIKAGYDVRWLFIAERDNKYEFNDMVLKIAAENNIEVIRERIGTEHLKRLVDEGCDVVVSAAYPYKIPTPEEAPCIINIHPEMLPRGRGPWPLPQVILNNLQVSGITIHKVTAEMDGGDILTQQSFAVGERDNLESLSCKVQMKAPQLLLDVLENFCTYWARALPQENGEYWPMPQEKERLLDWSLPVAELDKIARAFGKFGSFAEFDGKEWLVEVATVWTEQHKLAPGTVAHRTNKEVVIAASDGFVCLRYYEIDPDFAAEHS